MCSRLCVLALQLVQASCWLGLGHIRVDLFINLELWLRVELLLQVSTTKSPRGEQGGVDSNSPTGSWASFWWQSFSPKAGKYRPLLLGTWLESSSLCPWYYLETLVHWLLLLALALALPLASVVPLALASVVRFSLAQALALVLPLDLALAQALILTLALPLASDLTPFLRPLWLPFGEVGRVPLVVLQVALLEVAVGELLQKSWTHVYGRAKGLPSRLCVPRLPPRDPPPRNPWNPRSPLGERSLPVPNQIHWGVGHPPMPLLLSRLSLLLPLESHPDFPPSSRQIPGCTRKEPICQSCANVRANGHVLMRATNKRPAIL